MKKIINTPGDILEEMLSGFSAAYAKLLYRVPNTDIIATNKQQGQVGLVSGGGSGHEPSHAGFVGTGMLTAAVCGQVFTSPTPDQILAGIQVANQGKGVLLIIKNYSGDIMNFEMAKELAEMEDIPVGMVIVDDDIAVENSTYTQGKRGVAGTILVHKILGHAAQNGASLEELVSLGETIIEKINTIGVALSGATVPEVGKPGFVLPEDELEFGVGIHGEQGYSREKMKTSTLIATEMISRLHLAAPFVSGKQYAVLINGLGSTPLMEQYIFYHDVAKQLEDLGVQIAFSKIGNYMTAIDMTGVSLTIMEVTPAELAALEATVETVAW